MTRERDDTTDEVEVAARQDADDPDTAARPSPGSRRLVFLGRPADYDSPDEMADAMRQALAEVFEPDDEEE